jgi:hypothetical protein
LAGITPIKSSSVQEEAKKHLLPHSSSKKDKKASKHLLERPESIVSPSLSSTLSQHQAPTSSARTAQPNISTSTPQEAKKGLSLHSPFSKKQPRPATVENPQASANATQSLDEAEETAKIKAATEMDACSLASDDMDTKKMEETLPNQVGVTQSQQEEKEILTNSQENEDDISKLLEGKKSPPPTPAKQQEDTALSPSTINFGFF